jgi:exodeoxyribonuclease V gamma subunit
VIVMVPDIDAYAPHIQAVFGLIDSRDPRFIPFSIADQGQGRHDPLVGAIGKLLDLPTSRVAVSDVLDLLEVPALRSASASPKTAALLQRWIHGARVRWGLHAEHRRASACRRRPRATPGCSACAACCSATRSAAPAGVARHRALRRDRRPRRRAARPLAELSSASTPPGRPSPTAPTWPLVPARLRRLMADFFAPDDSADAFTLQQLDLALERWQAACQQAGLDSPLPLAVVGEHWLAQLDDSGLSQRFFAGAVTFATLMPMRAIPSARSACSASTTATTRAPGCRWTST